MNQTITIYLHDKNGEQTGITVCINDTIESLNILKERKNVCLLFHNSVLLPSFSFGFYGISNGDHIFVVQSQEPKKPRTPRFRPVMHSLNEQKHMFTDHNKLSVERRTLWETIRNLNHYPLFQMMSHNLDTSQNTAEFNLECCNLYQMHYENDQQQKKNYTDNPLINLPPCSTPCTDALPTCW